MKKLFATAALVVAAMSASAQPEGVTAHAPIVPWGAQAEIIISNDLTEQDASGGWQLTADAQKWIQYSYDGAYPGTIQQTNRPNVWYDFYDETTDTMVIAANHNWGGYLTVSSKTGATNGLMVVGKTRFPKFNVTGTDKVKFYFSGSAGTAGYPQIEVYEEGATTPIVTKTGTVALTKSTWDTSTLLIADGLEKTKKYQIVARTMNADGAYEGGDIVLQVVKIYGEQAPLREDGVIISGSEIGSYINAHLAQYPAVTDFTLEGNGKYTIKEGITAAGKFTLTGVASARATIDASALAAPFVQFAEIAEDAEKDANGFVAATNVKFANVQVTGLAQSLFSSNKQNYLIPELTIDNSVIALAGNPFVIDFRNGGVVAKLSVNKSTIWAAEATGNSFFTGQSGKKATEAGLEEQIFSFTNSTLSNLTFGKNFFTHRQNGQTWLTFEVKNNIIANCGKDNFLASLNGGQASANPKYIVENNTFLKTTTETAEDETTKQVLSNINDLQTTSDETEEIVNPVAGVPFTLANALAGNFTLTASSLQAKNMIGDARWLVPYATDAIKIEVDKSENTDFIKAINAALEESEAPNSITVTFYEAGEYETSAELNTTSPITFQVQDIDAGEATIVAKHGMTLGGAITFNGVNVNAKALETPFITLQANPYKLQDNGFYNFGAIKFQNMNVSDLPKQLVYGNKVKNLISEFLVDNCMIDLNTGSIVPFDFNGGGVVANFNIKKSTIFAADATSNSLYSSQSGNKATEAGLTVQNFAIDNSTLHNIATGKNFFTHRQSNQTWLAYYLRNSVFVNVGKAGQVVKGINGGQSGKNPKWTVSGNIFATIGDDGNFVDQSANEDTGDSDEPVQNKVIFQSMESPIVGPVLLSYGSYVPTAIGDPRYNLEIIPVVELDYTAKVGTAKESWTGAGGTAGGVTTSLGLATPLVELYNSASAGVKMQQTIAGLPNGTYIAKVFATSHNARGEDGATLDGTADDVAYVFATGAETSKTWITASGVTPGFLDGEQTNTYSIQANVTNGELTLGLAVEKEKMTGWHTIQIYSLSRLVPLTEAWDALVATVDTQKKMSDAVKAQFEAAKSADKTLANYEALKKAVNAINASINSYEIIAAGVIADNQLNNWTCTTGNTFHINTWSTEGASDNSGMVTPFIEDWRNANEGNLGNGQILYTLPYLNAGKYEVSALVRLYSEKGNTPEGASFFVGQESKAIAGTECQAGSAKGIYGTVTAQGEVDADGNLKFGVAVENANFNWVAIKSITIKEVAEQAVSGEVTYALTEGDTFKSGDIVEVKDENGAVATIQYGEAGDGYADFAAAKADGNAKAWGYTASTGGNGQNGNKAGGTFYTITPKYNGVIAVAVTLNADKKFHLVVDGEQNAVFDNNTVTAKYNGPIEFNVVGGKTYKFYCDGSKLGFFGFNYKYGPEVAPITETTVAEQQIASGIVAPESVKTNADDAIYNLNGQKVQNVKKGLYIINGKKVVIK